MKNEVITKESLAPKIVKLIISAPEIAAKAEPGHFVVVRLDETAERIPLTLADFEPNQGTITLIIQEIGQSTAKINQMKVGDSFLDILGPLGTPYPVQGSKRVVGIAGGLGAAPLYPKLKALKKKGNEIITILGALRQDLLIYEAELRAVSEQLIITTDDGSYGQQGLVTKPLEEILKTKQVDEVLAIGPLPMMEACCQITKQFGIKTLVSLNAVMVDGTGMCGGCRVKINGENKFCCVDGPTFDGLAVDFNELRHRQRYYQAEERAAYQTEQGAKESCRCRVN